MPPTVVAAGRQASNAGAAAVVLERHGLERDDHPPPRIGGDGAQQQTDCPIG